MTFLFRGNAFICHEQLRKCFVLRVADWISLELPKLLLSNSRHKLAFNFSIYRHELVIDINNSH